VPTTHATAPGSGAVGLGSSVPVARSAPMAEALHAPEERASAGPG
jgi:hypothetical protein